MKIIAGVIIGVTIIGTIIVVILCRAQPTKLINDTGTRVSTPSTSFIFKFMKKKLKNISFGKKIVKNGKF